MFQSILHHQFNTFGAEWNFPLTPLPPVVFGEIPVEK